ncbi:MAG: EF-P lysine aminoacylase EpmA [bacterium]
MIESSWQPTCSFDSLQLRSRLLRQIRTYFQSQNVLEIETPLISQAMNTDPMMESIHTDQGWLATSPEFPMKRLLCAGCGSIYQYTRVFRKEQGGRYHNSEFSMLEWYRVDWDDRRLADEVVFLVQQAWALTNSEALQVKYVAFEELFNSVTGLKLSDSIEDFQNHPALSSMAKPLNHQQSIDWLFATEVQPAMPVNTIVVVLDYPHTMAALARLDPDNKQIARRFEVFVNGVELANGYWELSDAEELEQRFKAEQESRAENNQPLGDYDHHLIQALYAGLPDCAGVALGIDRLLMLIQSASHINQVLAFPYEKA